MVSGSVYLRRFGIGIIVVVVLLIKEPGKMEAELARVDIAYLMKNILTTRKTGPPIFPKGSMEPDLIPILQPPCPPGSLNKILIITLLNSTRLASLEA
ncbi:hypothetical protein E2542_SST23790 [Spatholobus suberectus]|nr:hypothetical protein E2542_SST23790 [Spatholobus suberectus]